MVLFLNKKKLQEQKPLVNNTYQGKYDYSQMQYLPEDQRFGFDTLVEVARDTNKKSLWDIFSKKPKMVFPVGEGLNEEAAQKAHEIVRQPAIPEAKIDYPSAQKNVRDFLNNFTPREEAVPVRRAFEKEPVMTKAPPIVTSLGQLGFSILEAIPRAVATFYGEVSAPERKTGEVDIGINAKRLGYENEKYRTAAKEFKDKVEAGENPWIAGLNVVSNKTLDVAFGAQLLSSISRFITRKLTSGAIDRKLAKETVDAFKKNQKQLFESTKNFPLLEREKALADLTNARDVAERILTEKGLPTTLDKARIGISKYTDILGRETSLGKDFWSRFAQPDINIKPTELAPSPIAGLLPGERPKPGQAPNIGLSLQEVEGVGKPTTNTSLTKQATSISDDLAKLRAQTVETQTIKKYKTIQQGGIIKEIDGEDVKIVEGIDTFLHKDVNGNWVVSETTTGRSLNDGGFVNKSFAIKNAKENISNVGETKFKELILKNKLPNEVLKKEPIAETNLIREAKKYKSAEEFVKAQGVTKDYVAEVKPTKLRADDRSVFKTAGEARGNAREITNKEIEIADRDQKIFDANKDKTIPQLQKEIAESKKWADENSVSYPRSIQVKEEIIKTKSQLTDIWNKAQANTKPATETLKPAVIQGETFTLGTSKTNQPTIKELKLDLKATQKEIKNAQIAQEKANKLERKEQKIREEAIANLQRFRGNTENIKADLEKRNLSQEDIDNIILEDGTKLNDAIKVKRNSDGSLSDVITKKEIDDLKASYTDEIPKNKWQKRNVLVDGKEVATNAIQSLELPYSYFERKGLSSIYDQVIKSGRDAELLKNSSIQKFKDNDLFKDGSWFTADRFNIDKKEARAVSEYYLGRQGKTKPVELSSLPEKSQKFIKVFDEIINETTEPFYQMASKMGKQPGVVENYAPLMTSEDIKLIDQGGAQDWLFRKHPAFSALKERVKKAPVEVYEKDYRKVATRWLEGMSQFLEMSETTNHLKYLINSDEFKNIVKDSDYAIISKWLKDITTPKTPDTLIKKTFTPLSQLTRKGVAMGALGLNYATVLKQALTQIPIAIIEKSLPKTSSEYAKAFGINVKDLPSISKRKGDIAIQDLQGKISRIFTGSITKFDKMNAQTALNGLLDKEYNKVLKEGVPITKETQNLIEKNAQDKIDMWFGGFFKGQRPEAYREELGNFILMFTYPLTSQTNGFFRHILKAKGFKGNIKAVAEVLAAVVGIAYMEKVIENLSPQWSDEKEMTKDTLVSLSGNLPMVGDIVYSLVNDQDINLSPVIGNVNNIVRAISKGDGEKIFWTLAETVGLPKQVRRVKEGFQIMEDGGITDNNGKMLAPVQDAMEYIRAFLRGKYGPLAAKDYIRNVGAKKEDKRWFVPEVEFIQNGDYERKAQIYKTFDRQKKKEFYNMLSEGQQKKLDNALKGITPKSEGRKSLSDIFK